MQISQSQTYKKELEKIQHFLNECENEEAKNKVKLLVRDLNTAVKKVDTLHSDLVTMGRLAENVSSYRDNIYTLRKKIFSIIEKY